MQTYTVRNSKGIMLARMVGKPANELIDRGDGFWRTYQSGDDKRTVCYELTEDVVWNKEWADGALQIMFWAGTIIIKD